MNHQPLAEPVKRKKLKQKQIREICKSSVAFILATDENCTNFTIKFENEDIEPIECGNDEDHTYSCRALFPYNEKPCIQHVLDAVCKTQKNTVNIITTEKLAKEIEEASSSADTNNCKVKVLTVDEEIIKGTQSNGAGYDVFNISHTLLKFMRNEAYKIDSTYQNIIVFSSEQVRITPEHICELYSETKENEAADVITSWITFFPNLPLIFTRNFLENIDSKLFLIDADNKNKSNSRIKPNNKAKLKLPHLNVVDHIFGEEKLSVEPSTNAKIEKFLENISKDIDDKLPKDDNYSDNKYLSSDYTWPPENLDAKIKNADLIWADNFGKRCKLDFPLLMKDKYKDAMSYLDNAATSQRCARALQAMRDFDEDTNGTIYRGTYELSKKSTAAYNAARERIAQFIGAEDAKEVTFTTNTSTAINLVVQAWAWNNLKKGDIVAISIAMHHSSIVPFQILAEHRKIKIEYIPYDDEGRIDRKAFTSIMKKRPKLVCIPHVSNVFGIVEPVAKLADEAHKCGARVLLDAAQSLPHLPLNVKKLHVDWLAFSGHKAYGPFGIGVLWSKNEAAEEMEPLEGGGGTIANVGQQSYYLRTRPIQFELGTPPISQAIGLAAALDYLDILGMNDVQKHEAVLTKYLIKKLEKIDGITIIGNHNNKDGQVGLVSFTVKNSDSMSVVTFLGKLGIASRGGGHCALPLAASLGLRGSVRLSLGVYTTKRDIDMALEALRIYQKLA